MKYWFKPNPHPPPFSIFLTIGIIEGHSNKSYSLESRSGTMGRKHKNKATQRNKWVQEKCDNDSNVLHVLVISSSIDQGQSVTEPGKS